jgi:DNA-binding transcriptional ArsR family regulator
MRCKKDLFFQNFSSKLRLAIIETLLESPKNVGQICDVLDEEQSKVSHNLKKLFDCNFVSIKKDGKHRIYTLNETTIIPLMKLVDKHKINFCQNCKD